LGLPIETDDGPLAHRPWLTWSLALLILIVSLAAFVNLKPIIAQYGLVPAHWMRLGGLTFLTAFFLHAGVFHLLTNLYFLLVFGDNVEDFLGRWRFLALILMATLAGHVLHIIGDPASRLPCIGASGGISGVVAFYACKYPHARMGFLFRYVTIFRWVRMPAYLLFLLWIAIQVMGACFQVTGDCGVAYRAHLGGAVVGVLFWLATRRE
jgi:membrane associated rhomboid family serine protease